jgi:hypothetical protein
MDGSPECTGIKERVCADETFSRQQSHKLAKEGEGHSARLDCCITAAQIHQAVRRLTTSVEHNTTAVLQSTET